MATNAYDQDRAGPFEPVVSYSKADQVYNQLVHLLRAGTLRPGQRLPAERSMASALGVGRQCIREAMSRAQAAGLVEIRQGEGTFVRALPEADGTAEQAPPADDQGPLPLDGHDLLELLELRRLLEVWCVERAVRDASDATLAEIGILLERAAATREETPGQSWEDVDTEFHLALAQAAGNRPVAALMESLVARFRDHFRTHRVVPRGPGPNLLHEQHAELYAAMRQRDVGLARHKTLDHLNFVEQTLRKQLARSGG